MLWQNSVCERPVLGVGCAFDDYKLYTYMFHNKLSGIKNQALHLGSADDELQSECKNLLKFMDSTTELHNEKFSKLFIVFTYNYDTIH